MVPILGSALLALAVWKRAITVEEALIAARLDEAVQEAQWGVAPEAAQKWDAKCAEVRAAEFFLFHH
jgi:chaperone required for assembly of F1-ATPase